MRKAAGNGSLPGLYRRLTGYICKRYEERRRQQGLAIPYKNREELFDRLGKIALDALQQGEVLISQVLIDEVEAEPVFKDMLKDAGFLLLEEVGKQYQFPHLTFQEYFAGRRLAGQLLSDKVKVRKEAEKFLTKHQYEPQYGRMLSFLAGEASKLEEVDGTRQLLSLLEEAPQEVVGVQHVLLQMRLLNEWLCVAGEDGEEELVGLEEEFHVMASLEEWFCEGADRVRRGGYDGDKSKLLELLTSGLQRSRAVAAHAPALVEPLLEAMRDNNWTVRSAASEALGQVVQAAPAEQVLLPLLEAMRDSDYKVRSAAREALGQVVQAAPQKAEQVLPSLLEALRDSDDEVRRAASEALVQVVKATPQKAEQVLPSLLEALQDNNWTVRHACASQVIR